MEKQKHILQYWKDGTENYARTKKCSQSGASLAAIKRVKDNYKQIFFSARRSVYKAANFIIKNLTGR